MDEFKRRVRKIPDADRNDNESAEALLRSRILHTEDDLIRVHLSSGDRILISTFDSGLVSGEGEITEAAAPQWMLDAIKILSITEQGVNVEGMGVRVGKGLFYLIDKMEVGNGEEGT